ncbi:hypothetical protein ACTXT7_011761 [Hymenolepis weldensis]
MLSPQQSEVRLPKEVYQSLIIKSSGSATRLIRLLMKHFFSQEELAASSLSGEGIYKRRLKPDVTEAIKFNGSESNAEVILWKGNLGLLCPRTRIPLPLFWTTTH